MTIFVVFGGLDLNAAAPKQMSTTLRVKNVSKKHVVKVRANPLMMAAGMVGAEISTQIGNSPWSVGLYAERTKFGLFSTFEGYGFGGSVSYFFNGSPYRDSWYVTTGAYYRYGVVTPFLSEQSNADWNLINATALAGYQWHWSNFNMALGLGAIAAQATVNLYVDSTSTATVAASTDDQEKFTAVGAASGATLEFTMGYSF